MGHACFVLADANRQTLGYTPAVDGSKVKTCVRFLTRPTSTTS